MKKCILLTTVSGLVCVSCFTVDGSDSIGDPTRHVEQTQCTNPLGQAIMQSNSYRVGTSISPSVPHGFLHPTPQYNSSSVLPRGLTIDSYVSEAKVVAVPSSRSLNLTTSAPTGMQAHISEQSVSDEISKNGPYTYDRSPDQLLTLLSTSKPLDTTNMDEQTSEYPSIMCLENLERFWEGFLNDVRRYKLTSAIEATHKYLQQANSSYGSVPNFV